MKRARWDEGAWREALALDRSAVLRCWDSCTALESCPEAAFDAVTTDTPYASGGLYLSSRQRSTRDKYVQTESVSRYEDFAGDARDPASRRRAPARGGVTRRAEAREPSPLAAARRTSPESAAAADGRRRWATGIWAGASPNGGGEGGEGMTMANVDFPTARAYAARHMPPPFPNLATARRVAGDSGVRALVAWIVAAHPPGVSSLNAAALELGADPDDPRLTADSLRRAAKRAGTPLPAYPRGAPAGSPKLAARPKRKRKTDVVSRT